MRSVRLTVRQSRLSKAGDAPERIAAEELIMAANERVGSGLPKINDEEGHEVIVAMFKTALER